MHAQLGTNSGQEDTKRPKKKQTPTATSEEPGAKTGCREQTLCMSLHSTPPKGWAKHLSHPSSLTPGHTPTPTPYKEQAPPPLPRGANKGNCYLFLLLLAGAGAPTKICPNFLTGLLSISIDWGRPRTLVGINTLLINVSRASLVAQWLRICLPMQGTRVRALVWEDPTCHGATGPVSHNY